MAILVGKPRGRMKDNIMLLMGAMVIALLIAGASAHPDVYYYSDTCTVPATEHFLSFQTGIQDYIVWTSDIIHSDAPLINTYSGISERQKSYKLGMSKNEQEKIALLTAGRESGNALYCYTIPDPVQEARFGPAPEPEVIDPSKGYFTQEDGSIVLDGVHYTPHNSNSGYGTTYSI